MSKTFTLTVKDIDLIAYDFDGVMTDNRVTVREDGLESVTCSRADGMGVDIIRDLGIPQIILSTEINPVVRARAEKLKLPVVHGLSDKLAALKAHLKTIGGSMRRTVFVGNDVNDVDCLLAVGYPVTPADAYQRAMVDGAFITDTCGGKGVVRELAERLLQNHEKDS